MYGVLRRYTSYTRSGGGLQLTLLPILITLIMPSADSDLPSGSRREGRDETHRSKHDRASPERRERHKHKERDETEDERRERKRAKRDKEDRKDKDRSKGRKEKRRDRDDDKDGVEVIDDDDEGMWVEKGVTGVSCCYKVLEPS